MKLKAKNNTRSFLHSPLGGYTIGHFSRIWEKSITFVVVVTLLFMWSYLPVMPANAVGLDLVTVALDVETVTTASQVTVTFEVAGLVNGNTIDIYIGNVDSGGTDEWIIGSVTTTEAVCTDDGTSPTYTTNSVNAASATLPMRMNVTATTVGGSAATITCTFGNDTIDPTNPTDVDGYSVAVVTTNDSGAGVVYVGNGNDVSLSATVLPNLTLTIGTADGTFCTTSSGVTSCDLATILTGTENSGNYDVDVGTNAASGATVRLGEDGNLRNGANDIDDVGDGDITAGSEEYGVIITETGTAWTIDATYLATEAPIITGPDDAATSSGPVDTSTDNIDVIHRGAISTSTLALTYTHIATWTAVANF